MAEVKGDVAHRNSRPHGGFCPGETDEGSQAIHCLEQVRPRIRPEGHGLIPTHVWFVVLIVARLSDPIVPSPTGRFPFCTDTRQ